MADIDWMVMSRSSSVGRIPIIAIPACISLGPSLGVLEGGDQLLLHLAEHRARQLVRGEVELDVELGELGLEVLGGDAVEQLGVDVGGAAVGVDDVELHLEPGELALDLEAALGEHAFEDGEVSA